MNNKWLAPILPYLAVWAGLFLFKNAWLTLLGFHAAILLVLIIARPDIPIGILLKNRNPKWILANIILCGCSGIGIYYLRPIAGVSEDLHMQLSWIGLNESTWPLFIGYFSLVNPLIEEYFWRAYLGSTAQGFYIGDLAYAGYHLLILAGKANLFALLFALACLTFIGWFWRQTVRKSEGLLAAVLGHMAGDFSILLAVYFMAIKI